MWLQLQEILVSPVHKNFSTFSIDIGSRATVPSLKNAGKFHMDVLYCKIIDMDSFWNTRKNS